MQFSQAARFDPSHSTVVLDVQSDPLKRYTATCSEDGRINVFSLSTLEYITTKVVHKGRIPALRWSPPQYGSRLASCGYDGSVHIMRIIEKDVILEYSHQFKAPVSCIDWCPSSSWLTLAVSTEDGHVAVINNNNTSEKWRAITLQESTEKTSPSFVSWGKSQENEIYHLAFGQSDLLRVIRVDINDPNSLSFQTVKEISYHSNVVDLSWEHDLFEDQFLVVLTASSLQIFEADLNKCQQMKTNSKDINLRLGWGGSNTLLNVYSFSEPSFKVTTYRSNASGRFDLLPSVVIDS